MHFSNVIIRKATPGDAAAIATVHVESWKTTYRNLVSDEYLDQLSVTAKVDFWESTLTNGNGNVLVAERDGLVIGFASGGAARNRNEYEIELYAIYLLHSYQQKGVGRLLFSRLTQLLSENGFRSMYVWVLHDNPGKLFYERLGGVLFDEEIVTIGKQQLKEVAYGWTELKSLI